MYKCMELLYDNTVPSTVVEESTQQAFRFFIIAGSLESANWSILAPREVF